MTYAVTDQAVWVRRGIVFRQQRHVRLERIQAVDIVRPLFGRILGLGKLSVDAAGGAGSSLAIGYLRDSDLSELRAQILLLAAGLDSPKGEESDPIAAAEHPEAPEKLVYCVPAGRLVGSLMLSTWFVICMLALVASLVGVVILVSTKGFGVGLAPAFGGLPFIIGFVSFTWARFAREFGFQAAVSPDGIRIRRGLLEHRSETIPPRRVHAISITQPFLWRIPDWYRVEISQAVHRRDSGGESNVSHALMPVGSREEAMSALWLVLPDLGVPNVPDFFTQALQGTSGSHYFVGIAPTARLLDPLVRKRRGIAATRTCVVVRDGWLTRRASFAPYERIQSVVAYTGPITERLGLEGIRVALVPGPVSVAMPHLSVKDAAALRRTVVFRSEARRSGEPPERWFARVSADYRHKDHGDDQVLDQG